MAVPANLVAGSPGRPGFDAGRFSWFVVVSSSSDSVVPVDVGGDLVGGSAAEGSVQAPLVAPADAAEQREVEVEACPPDALLRELGPDRGDITLPAIASCCREHAFEG